MAAQKSKKINFKLNLIYSQDIPKRFYFNFFEWLILSGRFLILIVEAVAIFLFFLRFNLDAQLANIKNQINLTVKNIESKQEEELKIRHFQFKLSNLKKQFASEPKWKEIYDQIAQQVPPEVKFEVITFYHSESPIPVAKITGRATNPADIAVLLYGLKNNTSLRNPVIDDITTDEGMLVFTITGQIQ